MAGRIYNFENPDRFVAGAIGQAGSRTFYLQARDAGRLVSILVEKVQVALLAERLTEMLAANAVPACPTNRPRTRSTVRPLKSLSTSSSVSAPWPSSGMVTRRRFW